jgi:hypothetical protein
MITNEQIKKIISDCASSGYTIKGKDIAYVILCRTFQDTAFCYASAFGISNNPDAVTLYDQSSPVTFLKKYMDINHPSGVSTATKRRRKGDVEDISFEENKAEIIKLIKDTQKALEDGTIEPKDALKIQADLRVKLNDKFQVQDEAKEQLVIVEKKFNSICACGREYYAPTKEELMQMYDLEEKR